jgi:antitoxin HicB
MSKHKNIGSDFKDFLKKEGILEEVESAAAKKAFVIQLEAAMKKKRISKTRLARLMKTSRSSIDRLLDPSQSSTLTTITEAAHAVGKHVRILLV